MFCMTPKIARVAARYLVACLPPPAPTVSPWESKVTELEQMWVRVRDAIQSLKPLEDSPHPEVARTAQLAITSLNNLVAAVYEALEPEEVSTNEGETTENPYWRKAVEDARKVALDAHPPCRCMGPTANIKDDGRGPILEVQWGHPITPEDIKAMDDAVSALGWRGWAYSDKGIAFKPTWVDLGP